MVEMSRTAAVDNEAGVVTLATGDIRIPVYDTVGAAPGPSAADQPYPTASGPYGLREAVAAGATASGSAAIDPAQVVVAPGARQAIMAVLHALPEHRREVLLPTPFWSSYPQLIRFAGGAAVTVPGPVGRDDLDTGTLERRRTAATGAIVLNSPRNPDGAVIAADRIRALIGWADRYGLAVLFDQVYRGVPRDGGTPASVLSVCAELPEHCAVVDGLTKSHALAGLRVGWVLANGRLGARVAAVASHLFGGVCAMATRVATNVLRGGGVAERERIATELATNLDRAMSALARVSTVDCGFPEGGFFLFPDVSRWLNGPGERAGRDVAGWLRERHGVAIVDGTAFGAPGHIRLSVAVPRDQLALGLRRLTAALSAGAASER